MVARSHANRGTAKKTHHGFDLVEDVEDVVHRWTLRRVVRPAPLDETLDPLGYGASSRPGESGGKFGAETSAHLPPAVQMTSIRPEHVQTDTCETGKFSNSLAH